MSGSSIPLPMTPNMFTNFDDSSIRRVWRVMRNLAIPQLTDDMSPVPYIESANYFDMLNVFVETSENFLDSAMLFFGRPRKFKYTAKLKDVLNFTTSDKGKIRQMLSITESKMYKFRPSFEHIVEGRQSNISKMYFFRAEDVKLFVMRFEFDTQVGMAMDRIYPGLEAVKRVLVISEVCCAERVIIRTRNGGPSDIHEWTYKGPVPLAFGASKFKLDKMGLILVKKLVPKRKLEESKFWVAPSIPHPPFCPVLRVVTKGKHYSIDRRYYDEEEGHGTTSLSKTSPAIIKKPKTSPVPKLFPAVEKYIEKEKAKPKPEPIVQKNKTVQPPLQMQPFTTNLDDPSQSPIVPSYMTPIARQPPIVPSYTSPIERPPPLPPIVPSSMSPIARPPPLPPVVQSSTTSPSPPTPFPPRYTSTTTSPPPHPIVPSYMNTTDAPPPHPIVPSYMSPTTSPPPTVAKEVSSTKQPLAISAKEKTKAGQGFSLASFLRKCNCMRPPPSD